MSLTSRIKCRLPEFKGCYWRSVQVQSFSWLILNSQVLMFRQVEHISGFIELILTNQNLYAVQNSLSSLLILWMYNSINLYSLDFYFLFPFSLLILLILSSKLIPSANVSPCQFSYMILCISIRSYEGLEQIIVILIHRCLLEDFVNSIMVYLSQMSSSLKSKSMNTLGLEGGLALFYVLLFFALDLFDLFSSDFLRFSSSSQYKPHFYWES